MRYARVVGGRVIDVVEQGSAPDGWLDITGMHVGPGFSYDGDVFSPPCAAVPDAVTMRQARIALHRSGLLASVDTAIAGLPEPQRTEAQIEWGYSQEVQRHNGFVAILAPLLGLDDAALDALFTLSATL